VKLKPIHKHNHTKHILGTGRQSESGDAQVLLWKI